MCVWVWEREKYGAGAMAAVGSGRTSVPWADRLSVSSRGERRSSGSTKVPIRFSDDEVKMVVPSADLGALCVSNWILEKLGGGAYHWALLKKESDDAASTG